MRGLPRRTLVSLALALVVAAVVLDGLLLTAWGSRAPGWSHWWCSPSTLHASARYPGSSPGGLVATALNPLKALLPHWPHLLPLLLALATLAYLWRANARYHTAESPTA